MKISNFGISNCQAFGISKLQIFEQPKLPTVKVSNCQVKSSCQVFGISKLQISKLAKSGNIIFVEFLNFQPSSVETFAIPEHQNSRILNSQTIFHAIRFQTFKCKIYNNRTFQRSPRTLSSPPYKSFTLKNLFLSLDSSNVKRFPGVRSLSPPAWTSVARY